MNPLLAKIKGSGGRVIEGDQIAIYVIEDYHRPGAVRYVGKATAVRQRWSMHLKCAMDGEDQPLYHWMRQPGVAPIMRIIGWVAAGRAGYVECSCIRKYKGMGFPLLNVCHGEWSSDVWAAWKEGLKTNPLLSVEEVVV